ncbi:hypothetical protein NDR87_20700 [Nocardia sp. CDC159]|uniref:Uncharacterized protein n=1 Tax=Nocardia pulmonis TaxID=2951408 RepID=A0A9X2J0W5_9NOCA|nr:hypothetical protein [Nocardia sp. CDC159]MCM6776366.1 hypothetical protein [Nocardia pulmonis]MCM6788790.1 hypothetical protein [Nocardia sp. CDC159]
MIDYVISTPALRGAMIKLFDLVRHHRRRWVTSSLGFDGVQVSSGGAGGVSFSGRAGWLGDRISALASGSVG